jgi:hypothetical protein
MIELLLKLILAHLVGDFILQPEKWVKNKEKKKLKSVWLYLHIAVHIGLMFLFLWDTSQWKLILLIALIHFIIDVLKLTFQTKKNKRWLFFTDQILHFTTILILTPLFYTDNFKFNFTIETSSLLLIVSVIFLTKPTSILMKTIFSKWNISKITKGKESLIDAGMYIGVLERLLVFVFIINNQWEAVGFLITAKSVFRFGDLTASKERKLTEYILIGTLISFGIAILISILYLNIKIYV